MRLNQKRFLAAYRETGNIRVASAAAEIDRRRHYEWLEEEEYKQAFDAAREEAAELLEEEARRRAYAGVRRPVLDHGSYVFMPLMDRDGNVLHDSQGRPRLSRQILYEHTYSDTLLMFLLKGARPTKYRDNAAVEVGGAGGAPIKVEVVFVRPEPKPAT